ncbi:cadherin-like beta sandwich domain-containing protein [Clostridium sp. E02]|uniref:cadherin-like beta sandwich domain-containing protein n=1 Tax=Clostridium sp. E02 TaxID=2487134 RepID=UPI000F5263DB|nr:cadherin-like beta sandwich domain-containing protein [Clostridium sp. E02]
MNKKLKKIMSGLLLVCIIAAVSPICGMTSWASEAKVAFSDPSVMVGNEVTVTMKISSDTALGTADIMLSYDPGILEFMSGTSANGGAGAIKLLGTMDSADQKTFSFQLKFKTLKAGNSKITVTSQEIYDVNSNALTLSKKGNSTVKVTSPATYSKDATLKSLKISPGTLTPGFSSSVESYTAEVDANTTNLVVNAVAANAGAHVTLQGEKDLKAGANAVVVKVSAEDGQTVKEYTIQVTKQEGDETTPADNSNGETKDVQFGDATVAINGTEYSIASSFDESSLPEGFESQNYQYKGTEVMAGKGLEKDLLLLYLKDNSGNGGFFIYNESADSWSQFVQVKTTTKAIVIIPLDADTVVPEGFAERTVNIDGSQVVGWAIKSEKEPDYCLFYAMNWNGEKHFYRYDISEQTIQRYFDSEVSGPQYNKLEKSYQKLNGNYRLQFFILIGLGVLVLVLLVIIILLVKKGNGQGPGRTDASGNRGGKRGRRQRPEEEDRFEPKPEEQIPSSKIKRYSREEFNQEQFHNPMESDSEDDFMVETSLEDMERDLTAERNTEYNNHIEAKTQESLDDDFEFVDLDD